MKWSKGGKGRDTFSTTRCDLPQFPQHPSSRVPSSSFCPHRLHAPPTLPCCLSPPCLSPPLRSPLPTHPNAQEARPARLVRGHLNDMCHYHTSFEDIREAQKVVQMHALIAGSPSATPTNHAYPNPANDTCTLRRAHFSRVSLFWGSEGKGVQVGG